ncbi:hypothetical protein PFLmoz3_06271 [Pseudomonas fluorescens]|uniref:Transposase n=1 Tax=Pseudomonas fluorescens TaxID=294 RepID=A0A109KI03_PSEFL|nr:hypothetical protein PFLmoz3_06271 [Pseudomonas fluorescens]
MAKRYELSDEAWTVVADLFTETHGRVRPCLSNCLSSMRSLGALFGRCMARYVGTFQPLVNGVSTVSGLAKPGHIRSDAQALTPEIE